MIKLQFSLQNGVRVCVCVVYSAAEVIINDVTAISDICMLEALRRRGIGGYMDVLYAKKERTVQSKKEFISASFAMQYKH
jgi:hypothetical protein